MCRAWIEVSQRSTGSVRFLSLFMFMLNDDRKDNDNENLEVCSQCATI